MLKSYIDNNERDKITAAEKRLLRRNVQNRYKEVLRDQHLKKMFEADARKNKKDSDRSSVNSDAAKSKKSKGEDSSELEEEQNQGGTIYYDQEFPYTMNEINQEVSKVFSYYLKRSIADLKVHNEDIINFFQESQYRMRIFGVPLEQQKTISKVEVVNEEISQEKEASLPARAIMVKIFASDVVGVDGKERDIVSTMYVKTFIFSKYTTFKHILDEACKFWGQIPSQYEIWEESTKMPEGVDTVLQELKVSNQLSQASQMSKSDKASSGSQLCFYLGRKTDNYVRGNLKDINQSSDLLVRSFDATNTARDDDFSLMDDFYSGIRMESDFRKKWEAKKKYDREELNTGAVIQEGGPDEGDKKD